LVIFATCKRVANLKAARLAEESGFEDIPTLKETIKNYEGFAL
jgi:hypothetical protein